jgi:hypothetical protein
MSIRRLTQDVPLKDEEFVINVNSFMGLNEWSFGVNHTHTIWNLKHALVEYLNADVYEISLTIGLDHPYSLRDDLYLHELREDHRTLHVMIKENPTKAIPRRLLIIQQDEKKVLDLREMRNEDIRYIGYNWIVSYDYSYRGVYRVILSYTNPLFEETLKKIVDTIDSSLDVEERPQYPLHYFIDGVNDENLFIQNRIEALSYFYDTLNRYKNFHRIRLYLGIENPKLITKEWVKEINHELSEKMWVYK